MVQQLGTHLQGDRVLEARDSPRLPRWPLRHRVLISERATILAKMGNANLTIAASSSISIPIAKNTKAEGCGEAKTASE